MGRGLLSFQGVKRGSPGSRIHQPILTQVFGQRLRPDRAERRLHDAYLHRVELIRRARCPTG